MPSKPSSAPYAYVAGSVMNPLTKLTIAVRVSCAACSGVMLTIGRTLRARMAGGERGECRGFVVGVHGFLVVGVRVDPHRGDEEQALELVGAQDALARGGEDSRGHAGLRRAPREPGMTVAGRGIDR